MRAGTPLDDDDRWPWLRALAGWIGEHEAAGRSCVLTCSALKRSYRDLLREGNERGLVRPRRRARGGARASGSAARKGHYMPPSLLDSQLATLEPLQPDEPGLAVPGTGGADRGGRRDLAALTRQAVTQS